MKARSAIILILDDRLALIERHKQGRHYYVFPGGKVEADETPTQAAAREVEEELGLKVKVGTLVAEVWYLGSPQYYFLAERTGGEFGQGRGAEMSSQAESKKGTYHPLWLDVSKLQSEPVLPKVMATFVWKACREGWPEKTLNVKDQPPDDLEKD